MNEEDLNTISNICVSCGMCCDGTLFNKGTIKGEEDRKTVEKLGMEIIEGNNLVSFKQPCICFDKVCTIYGQTRPAVCSTFLCDPIKKYENGEQSLENAFKQINSALNLKKEILNLANSHENLISLSWQNLLEELDPILQKSEPTDLKKYGKIILLYASFLIAKKVVYTAKIKTD
jgi:uncharacterized protein